MIPATSRHLHDVIETLTPVAYTPTEVTTLPEPSLLSGPIPPSSPDFPLTLGYGVRTWECALGMTRYRLDTVHFEFYLDCAPDAAPSVIRDMLPLFTLVGLEPMDDIEPELLEDGWIRRWFVPTVPVDDTLLFPLMSACSECGA